MVTPYGESGPWNPWGRLREMEREMRRLFGEGNRPRRGVFPPVNIWTSADGAVVTAELPGVDPNDLEIVAVGDTLTISGELGAGDIYDECVLHRRERPAGRFSRSIELPFAIDPGSVEARCRDGVLEVRLQRPEEQKPRKITVKAE